MVIKEEVSQKILFFSSQNPDSHLIPAARERIPESMLHQVRTKTCEKITNKKRQSRRAVLQANVTKCACPI